MFIFNLIKSIVTTKALTEWYDDIMKGETRLCSGTYSKTFSQHLKFRSWLLVYCCPPFLSYSIQHCKITFLPLFALTLSCLSFSLSFWKGLTGLWVQEVNASSLFLFLLSQSSFFPFLQSTFVASFQQWP